MQLKPRTNCTRMLATWHLGEQLRSHWLITFFFFFIGRTFKGYGFSSSFCPSPRRPHPSWLSPPFLHAYDWRYGDIPQSHGAPENCPDCHSVCFVCHGNGIYRRCIASRAFFPFARVCRVMPLDRDAGRRRRLCSYLSSYGDIMPGPFDLSLAVFPSRPA